VLNASFGATACLRLLISKALGLGIVLFGSILKLPQMAKIVRAHSARGVSVEMYALEVVAYTISLAYAVRLGIPFSTYGENASLTLQSECWEGQGRLRRRLRAGAYS
jgi:mannose-P-dolichol utilization defect protein 1